MKSSHFLSFRAQFPAGANVVARARVFSLSSPMMIISRFASEIGEFRGGRRVEARLVPLHFRFPLFLRSAGRCHFRPTRFDKYPEKKEDGQRDSPWTLPQ